MPGPCLNRLRRPLLALLLAPALALALARPAAAAERLVLQLRWDHQFQFAGYYAAAWQGYYREAGLEVDIRSAVGPDKKALQAVTEVVAGRADFGIGAADVLVARDQGSPLVIVASIFQHSPTVVVARRETGLSSPADLQRLRVRRYLGDSTDVELQAMLRAEGIDPQTIASHLGRRSDGQSFDLLLQGRIDAYAGYSLTSKWRARETGLAITTLRPASYGIDFYGDSLFTSTALAQDRSGLVQRFVAASLKGWEYALEHPQEIAKRITTNLSRSFPVENALAFNLFQADEIKRLASYPLVELGHSNPARWGAMHHELRRAGLIRSTAGDETIVFDPRPQRVAAQRRVILLVSVGLAIALLVIAGAGLWTLALRRRVAARTAELQASESLYRAILDGMMHTFYRTDPEGRIVMVSPSVESLMGYRPDEVIGHNLAEFYFSPDVSERGRAALQESDGRVEGYETVLRHKDGTPVWISTNAHFYQDANGRTVGIEGTVRDISLRRAAEQAFRESEARFRDFAESSSDWFWEMDESLRFSSFSGPFEELGVDTSQRLGKTRQESTIEDISQPKWQAHLADLEAHRPFKNFEHAIQADDGSIIEISISGVPVFDEAGGFRGYRGTAANVTRAHHVELALRNSEARFAAILDIAPEAIIALGGDQNIELFNQGAERIFGYQSEEVIGQHLDMLIPRGMRENHRKYVDDFGRGNEVSRNMETRNEIHGLRKDGQEFPAAASITKLELDGERIFTVILQDISNRKSEQRELQIAIRQAQTANQAKSMFLANVSHELRTPLNAIIGFSDMMKKEMFGPMENAQYRDYVEHVFDSGRHLLELINDILDLSKIEAGKAVLDERELDVRQLIETSLGFFSVRASEVGLSIDWQIQPDLPALKADNRMLKQVLINLLSNAIKFTPSGGTITVSAAPSGDGGIELTVADNGIGMANEDIPTAMTAFGQVDGKLNRSYDGTGLGLPLVKSLTELHDAEFELESEVGVGTRAIVRFPPERIVAAGSAKPEKAAGSGG